MTVASQVKTCFATIKNIEATLGMLASQTNELEASKKYKETEKVIREIKEALEKQVLLLAREEPQYNK
ncbi:DUF1657 domain-containing protein [Ornithinibacillus sp. 179-J 7C1 HS]|uniref:DUF1657 domain-containing protein n=1 Tax=Ornithinibacillus sp. 179-J 7C1 HS TaxID=3142384 RepID=UPI00399F18A9